MIVQKLAIIGRRIRKLFGRVTPNQRLLLAFVLLFGIIGTIALVASKASTPTGSVEGEDGTVSQCATGVSDSSASSSGAVKFGTCPPPASSDEPSADAGASLPISYSLSSLGGTLRYVAPAGSDSGSGSISSPFATIAKAITSATTGDSIVLRGGTYRNQGALTISKSVKIVAYPGETPVFNGAAAVSGTSGWTSTGSLSYRTYTPIPVSKGSGITFASPTCGNQVIKVVGSDNTCTGQYPDQVWVGSKQYKQAWSLSSNTLTSGTFWVDSTNNRLYMLTSDLNDGAIEVSDERTFAKVSAPNVTLSGFKIIRYSNTPSDAGVINFNGTADNSMMQDMYESDTAFIAVSYAPSGNDLNVGSDIKDSSIQYSNWMGVSSFATTSLTIDHSDISNMNQFGEFKASPQSGSVKTSRSWYTKILNSRVMNNRTHALWFDQSNYKITVANNHIENNTDTGVFFEISDYIWVVNNYIKGNGGRNGIEISASSNAYIVNNTVLNSSDPIGVYVDSRSLSGCSTSGSCGPYGGSDVDNYPDHPHPATMTWFPSLNYVLNNIIAYPVGSSGYCGGSNLICITYQNASATRDISTIIHKANPTYGIPQTIINGNVYANGTGALVRSSQLGNWTSLSAFSAAMAQAPVSISGLESVGRAGNNYVNADGSPTSALESLHGSSYPIPSDANINPYVSAGTKHYGVTWK